MADSALPKCSQCTQRQSVVAHHRIGMRPGAFSDPQRFAAAYAVSALIITISSATTAPTKQYLVCREPKSELCLVWMSQIQEALALVRIDNTEQDITQRCGLSSIKVILSHRRYITVSRLNDQSIGHFFCKAIKIIENDFNDLKTETKVQEIQRRVTRQTGYSLRGRYRGQTQSQYLAIDRGTGKDDGKAEAHSAADSSRASVSGSSGMGQAQSQTMYDPSCDDCLGRSEIGAESLKRQPTDTINREGSGGISQGAGIPGGNGQYSPGGSRIYGIGQNGGPGTNTVYRPDQLGRPDGNANGIYGNIQRLPGGSGVYKSDNGGYNPSLNNLPRGTEKAVYNPTNGFGTFQGTPPGGTGFGVNNGSPAISGTGTFTPVQGNVPLQKAAFGPLQGTGHSGTGSLNPQQGNIPNGGGMGLNQGLPVNTQETYSPNLNGLPKTNNFDQTGLPGGASHNLGTFRPNQPNLESTPGLGNYANNQGGTDTGTPFGFSQHGVPVTGNLGPTFSSIPGVSSVYGVNHGTAPSAPGVPSYGSKQPGLPGQINQEILASNQQRLPGESGSFGPSRISGLNGIGTFDSGKPGSSGQVGTNSQVQPGPYGSNAIANWPQGARTFIGPDGTTYYCCIAGPNNNPQFYKTTGGSPGTSLQTNIPYGLRPVNGQNGLRLPNEQYSGPQNLLAPGTPYGTSGGNYGNQGPAGSPPIQIGPGGQQNYGQGTVPYGVGPSGGYNFPSPGQEYANRATTGPNAFPGSGGQISTGNIGGPYGPGSTSGKTDSGEPVSQYGPGATGGHHGVQGPGSQYGPGVTGGPHSVQGPGGQYGPESIGQNGLLGSGAHYGPGSSVGHHGPGDTLGLHVPGSTGGQYVPGGTSGQYTPGSTGNQYTPGSQYTPGGILSQYTPGVLGVQYGPGDTGGPFSPGVKGGQFGPGGTDGQYSPSGTSGQYGPGGSSGQYAPGGRQYSPGSTTGQYGPSGTGGQNGLQGPGGHYGLGSTPGQNSALGPNAQYSPGSTAEQHGVQGPGGQYNNGIAGSGLDPGKQYGPGISTGQTGYVLPDSSYGTGNTKIQNAPLPGAINSYEGNLQGPGLNDAQNGQYGPGQNSGFYPQPYGNGGATGQAGNGPYGFNNQGNTGQNIDYSGVPQNVIDPNSAVGSIDGDDSEAEASVSQASNGTVATASSKGGNEKGRAQTHVHGAYTDSGSFSAQAEISGDNKAANSEVTGDKKGASSNAQGSGRNNKSQANVQLGSETGSVLTGSQSEGVMHSSNTQVQGSVKGGMADAQARGPGSTSSQAQIGFTPYKEGDKSHELQKTPFVGGGTAGAQSSGRTGSSQSQLRGTFKYGITYNGAAQAGASLNKDTVFPNRLPFDKIDVNDKSNKNINVDTEKPSDIIPNNLPTTEYLPVPGNLDLPAKPAEPEQQPLGNPTEVIPSTDIPFDTQTTTEKAKDSESEYKDHVHADHHKTESQPTAQTLVPPVESRRSFPSTYGSNSGDYEYTTDKDDNPPEDYDLDDGFAPEVTDTAEGEQGEYTNYNEYSRNHESTHQSLQSPKRKGLEVRQTSGGSTQHIVLGSLTNQDAQITQKNSEHPDEGKVYQPGERVPGTGGYTIPVGFTGSVKSVASKDNTFVVGSKDSPSQAQTVSLTPGTGKIKYTNPSTYARSIHPKNLRSLDRTKSDDNNRYVSVSKSVTRDLDAEDNIRKQYSHTYFTKSSSCGYFSFTCTMVSGAEGMKKVCKPKFPKNSDGSLMKC